MPCVRNGLLTTFETAIGTFLLFFSYTVGISGEKKIPGGLVPNNCLFTFRIGRSYLEQCSLPKTAHEHTHTYTYSNKQIQWATSTLKL